MDSHKKMDLPNHLSNIKFNNFVVKTRGKVKQVLVRTCHKITREIKKYRNSTADSEEIKKKKTKKANRLAREMKMMKKLTKDDITKFALQFDKKPESILNDEKAHIKLKVLVKLSQNEIMKKCVQEFRQKYPNWTLEVPNIIRNIEMKKKGLKLSEDILKGESDRMAALAKYPTDGGESTKTLKSVVNSVKGKNKKKENGVRGNNINDRTQSIDEEEKSDEEDQEIDSDIVEKQKKHIKGNGDKGKGNKNRTVRSDEEEDMDSDHEEKLKNKIKENGAKWKVNRKNLKLMNNDNEEDEADEEAEEEMDSDNSENERLSRKLSEAFRRIEDENSDENEEDPSGDESEESGNVEKEEQDVGGEQDEEAMEEQDVTEGETSSNEDDDATDSSQDEFEEERKRRKLELIRENKKGNKNKPNTNNKNTLRNNNDAEVETSNGVSNEKKKDLNKSLKKSNKNTFESKNIDKNHGSANDLDRILEKFDKKKSDRKGEVKPKKLAPQARTPMKEVEETVVDDFFFTKDNKEYQSRVKPNPVAEQGSGDGNRSERRQSNPQPKEVYRKGKKIVLNNRNKPSFSNFDKGFDKNETRFDKSDRFKSNGIDRSNAGAKKFSDRKSEGRFEKKAIGSSDGGNEKLHPSWEAKKRHQPAITSFQGKKIKFE